MIDHISLYVRDFARGRAFYAAALAPLGYEILMEFPHAIGLGAGGKPDLWIIGRENATPAHVAIRGERPAVDAFHAAAIAAGGTDHGMPGPRPQYHADYYGAFVLDPEGNNIEAVCHAPPGAGKATRPKRAPAKKAAAKKAKRAAKKAPVAKKAPAKNTAKKAAAKKKAKR